MAETSNWSEVLRAGWPTFFGAPPATDLDSLAAGVAFLGVPYDLGTNDRPGSRFGPLAIREASMRFAEMGSDGWWDLEAGRHILRGVSLADCGDVDIRVVDMATNFAKIEAAVRGILRAQAFPVLVGGDHSITYPVLRGFAPQSLTVVQFDAHLDFTDEFKGVRFSYDNPMRRVLELPHVERLVQVGIRGVLERSEPIEAAERLGTHIVPAHRLVREGTAALASAPLGGPTYISIDIDVLDPAGAPGTGFPEPGGIGYYLLSEALKEVVSRSQVVGFDLVEVNPEYDASQTTARTAARLILHLLGAIVPSRE